MVLDPLQAVLPILSDLARFSEESGGLAIRLEGLDLEWGGRHLRFFDGQVRVTAGSPSPPPVRSSSL